MILEEDVSLNHSSLTPHRTSLTKRVQIFFQKSAERRLAIIDLKRHCIFSIRFGSTYSLFFTAVTLFYSIICTPLFTVPFHCSFSSYQCYHHVIQSRAFSEFYCSPVRVAIRPDESLLLVGWKVGVFSTFYNSWAKTFIIYNMSRNRGRGPERWGLLKKA